MSRLVLQAKQLAAESVVAEQRLAHLAKFGLAALSHRFKLKASPLLQAHQHRIGVALATGLLISLFIAPLHAQSYPTQYLTTVWQTEQGLPQNSVNALLQDHDGYLWVGTFEGLARFDGERFRVLGPADLSGLGSLEIISLYESRSGALWIGTAGGGLMQLDHGVAATYTERDGLPSGFINSIHGDAEGKVWISTSEGIAHFAGAKFEAYPTHRGKAVSEFYLQARDRSMWFRSGTREVVRFGADGSIAILNARQPGAFLVHESRDGSVWIGLRDEYRLVRYSKGVFSDVPLPPVGGREMAAWPTEGVLTITEDRDGELLLLTPAGVVRTVGGRLSPPETLRWPATGSELRPKVRSLLVDREGNVWIGMIATGLVRLRPAPLTAYGKDEGLSDSSFNAVFQDREGRIWLGGDFLYWFDGHRFHLFPGVTNIVAITQTRDGDLWFGGYGGVYRWRSGVLTTFQVDAPLGSVIYQDREGTLWIGAAKEDRPGGLYRFVAGKLDQIRGISGVHQIIEDRDGSLWVAGTEGHFHMRDGKAVPYHHNQSLPSHIATIHQDSTGTFWLATHGGGLFRLRDGQLNAITTKNGLPNNMLLRILEDGKGNLWVSSVQNIFRLSLKELNDFADGKISSILPVSYGIAEGMRSSECNGGTPGIWRTTDGRIWFATIRGVVAIDPAAGSRVPPPVALEEAWAKNVELGLDRRTSIPPGNDTFDFRFTALSLSAPEKQQFKYRLEPYDKDWVDAGTRRTAHYTNMPPGEYSFQVIAANSYGIWNDRGTGMRFVLRPHFYQTIWFYALCAIGFLALLWVGYQFRLQQVQRAFHIRLDERVEERTRIARELHDTLLQSFQGLMFSFQAARNLLPGRTDEAIRTLDGAIRKGDQAVAEGRDAIQNLRLGPDQRRLEDLLTATGQELRDAQDGNFSMFHVSMEGQPRTLSPLVQDEIYRIAREVLRNAFQHARARRIEAAIDYDSDLFRLRIRDDGKGIDPKVLQAGARAGHWGLPGIHERAKRIGAQLKLWSENGAGTEVELTVPARVAYSNVHARHRVRLFGKRKVES